MILSAILEKKKRKRSKRLKSYLIFHLGLEQGLARYQEYKKYCYLERKLKFVYGKEIGIQKYKEHLEKLKIKGTLECYIGKFGKEEGTKKYFEKNKKLSVGYDVLKSKGLNDEEIAKIKSTHSKKSARTLENYINQYGIVEGKNKYEKYINEDNFSVRRVRDWVRKGFSEKEAKIKVSEFQTRDLNFYIRIHGSELGPQKFKDFLDRKKYLNTVEYFIEKYGDEGKKIFDDYLFNKIKILKKEHWYVKIQDKNFVHKRIKSILKPKTGLGNNSKIQIEFCELLYSLLNKRISKFIGWPISNPEYILFPVNALNLKCCLPDIIINDKIIIEFDGYFWHSLPGVSEKYALKDQLLSTLGFHCLRIKEKDYRANKFYVTQQICDQVISILEKEKEKDK